MFIPEDLEASNISVKLLDGLYSEMVDYYIYEYPLQYSVPMYFILSENDWQITAGQGIVYFQKITPPNKKLILIDEATHSPPLEKRKEFLKALIGGC
jgi:pimeloyl-ACP methyl ester carboxylesterase